MMLSRATGWAPWIGDGYKGGCVCTLPCRYMPMCFQHYSDARNQTGSDSSHWEFSPTTLVKFFYASKMEINADFRTQCYSQIKKVIRLIHRNIWKGVSGTVHPGYQDILSEGTRKKHLYWWQSLSDRYQWWRPLLSSCSFVEHWRFYLLRSFTNHQ